MLYMNNYRGRIPMALYAKLLENYPQREGETEETWLKRVKQEPTLAQTMFGTGEFKTELAQAVQRRAMAQAGARRVGHRNAGPSLVKVAPGRLGTPVNTIAQRYRDEFMELNSVNGRDVYQYRYRDEAYAWLLEQFDASTPVNGSIFWNGINELALAKLVDEWNTTLGGEMFGQLEATTAARYVNKQFEWEEGGRFQQYFTDVSDRLGHEARGHVTSVVRCGLRHDSIFTVTELPRMLQSMEEQIRRRVQPTVTDLTIVVIEPKSHPARSIMAFTNNEITMIPVVRPLPGKRINGRDDCTVDGHVGLGALVRDYWTRRGTVEESAAAGRIRKDFQRLVKWP